MRLSFYVKISLAVVFCVFFFAAGFSACNVLVGVKAGDWIEYTVHTTGQPPKDINVTWAKMEVTGVSGTAIQTNVTVKAADGAFSSRIMMFNLTKGEVGAWFIVPAALGVGDCFWDESLHRNVTVEGEEQLQFAGAVRAVTNATTPQRLKLWDKQTGVFVECVDVFEDYSINATAVGTNLWEKQEVQQPNLLEVTVAAGVTVVAAAFVFVTVKLRRRNPNL